MQIYRFNNFNKIKPQTFQNDLLLRQCTVTIILQNEFNLRFLRC